MSTKHQHHTAGPFRADQLVCGDPYELANGHPVECLPGGGRHSKANLTGGLALGTDPAVESAGVDTGFAVDDKNLRAPDIAVGNVPDAPGWVRGTPPLAVEYADVGQDESDLGDKIRTLLDAGTRYVWVVRLTGPRRVEVHQPGVSPCLAYPGQSLEAPGVLQNPVPVEALYDPAAAAETALRNLLQRRGYADLESARQSAREEGGLALVLRLLERRIGPVGEAARARLARLDWEGLVVLAESVGTLDSAADLDDWLSRAGGEAQSAVR